MNALKPAFRDRPIPDLLSADGAKIQGDSRS